jgi:hypothetical protein
MGFTLRLRQVRVSAVFWVTFVRFKINSSCIQTIRDYQTNK